MNFLCLSVVVLISIKVILVKH